MGTVLPDDYKRYIENPVTERPVEFIRVYRPRMAGATQHNDLVSMGAEWCKALRFTDANDSAALAPEAHRPIGAQPKPRMYPVAVFPEPGGLLPWGTTENFGDVLLWETIGEPNEWKVVVANLRDGEFERHPLSFGEFIREWVSGRFKSNVIPSSAEAYDGLSAQG